MVILGETMQIADITYFLRAANGSPYDHISIFLASESRLTASQRVNELCEWEREYQRRFSAERKQTENISINHNLY